MADELIFMFTFKIKKNNKNKKYSTERGYAILYSVVIISIIMTIAIGLSNSVNKQLTLSSVARDSQAAFYQADTALECALSIQFKHYPYPTDSTFNCGLKSDGSSVTLTALEDVPGSGIFRIVPDVSSGPCFDLYVDESNPTPDNRIIKANGYSECNSSSTNRVERTFEVRY